MQLVMICLHCGKEIVQHQYGAESDASFQARLDAQLCRRKCARLHGPAKPDRGKPSLHLISACYDRGEGRIQEKVLPERDLARLAYARSLPCSTCGGIEGVHAHHEQAEGHGTMGGKTSDRRTIPLCPQCHVKRHEKGRSFWGSADVEKYIMDLNESYDRRG